MSWGGWVMTSRASLFNKSLLLSSLRRNWWISAIYTVILATLLPLRYIMTPPGNMGYLQKIQQEGNVRYVNLFAETYSLQTLFLVIVPVAAAVLIFSFMHNTRHSTFIHSLPCDRRQIFVSYSVSGLVLLLIPVIFNGIAISTVKIFTEWNSYILWQSIGKWVLLTLIYLFLFYAVCVFTGMFTGSAAAQIVFTYILHLLVPGVMQMAYVLAGVMLKGFAEYSSVPWQAFPITSMGELYRRGNYDSMLEGILIVYALLVPLFLAGAFFAYRFRPAESAGNVVSFRFLNDIFKYGVTVCTAMLFASFIASAFSKTFISVLIGVAIGSFLGYWIAEMLLQKSLKVWNAYKGYVAVLAVLFLIVGGIKIDVFGYVRKVPDVSEVESVYFGDSARSLYILERDEFAGNAVYPVFYNKFNAAKFTEEHDIKNIGAFHRAVISGNYTHINAYARAEIIYVLKNGKKINRFYRYDQGAMWNYISPIYNSQRFKEYVFPIIKQNEKQIRNLEITNIIIPGKPLFVADKKEIAEFLEVYRSDILNKKFESNPIYQAYTYNIRVIYEDPKNQGQRQLAPGYVPDYTYQDSIGFDNSFINTIKWLKAKGYYETIALRPEMIKRGVFAKSQNIEDIRKFNPYSAGALDELLKREEAVQIDDKDILIYIANEELFRSRMNYNSAKMAGILYLEIDAGQKEAVVYDIVVYEETELHKKLNILSGMQ